MFGFGNKEVPRKSAANQYREDSPMPTSSTDILSAAARISAASPIRSACTGDCFARCTPSNRGIGGGEDAQLLASEKTGEFDFVYGRTSRQSTMQLILLVSRMRIIAC